MENNIPEGMKRCTKCGEIKPATAEYFHRDKTMTCGLKSVCKECRREYDREYRQKNKDKIAEYRASNIERLRVAVNEIRRKTGATIYLRDMTDEQKEVLANQYVAVKTLEKTEKELLAASGKKRCPACDRILEYGCFNKDITTSDGVYAWCKGCRAEYSRKYNREYYEKNKDKIKEHYQQNKDKIKERRRQANKKKHLTKQNLSPIIGSRQTRLYGFVN